MSFWWSVPLIVAGIALGVLVWRAAHPRHEVIVGDRGILQRDLGLGWIPWDEIEGAYPPTAAESDTLRLRLRLTRRLARVLRKRRIAHDRDRESSVEVRLDLAESDLSAVELLYEIHQRTPSPV